MADNMTGMESFDQMTENFGQITSQLALNKLLDILKPFSKQFNIGKKLQQIHSRLNEEEFKIAVVANMSTGKSSFVNSLFGDMLLPAFHEATTGCLTYIYSFDLPSKHYAKVFFEDHREAVKIPADKVRDEIKLFAQKDSSSQDERYKNVDHIDLFWQFDALKRLDKIRFKFTFIDTPGPNNTGEFREKHKNVTNKLIREEADLILFLFDYGQLDANLSSDEQGLWEIIKSRSKADRFFDVFFIINKIDLAMEDDQKMGLERGACRSEAIKKLHRTAVAHGFERPSVFGVSSHLACLHKMNRKGLLNQDGAEYATARRAYKKVIIDFEEDEDPPKALFEYSGIRNIESQILNYIRGAIEGKVVNRVKWELQGVLKEIENITNQRISLLSQNRDEAEINIKKGLDFLVREIPRIRERLSGDFSTRRYECINSFEQVIESCAQKHLVLDLETIILKACYAAFYHLEKDMPWDKAKVRARNVKIDAYSVFSPGEELYQFKTLNQNFPADGFFAKVEEFISEYLSSARQEAVNAYKLEMNSIYENFINESNGVYKSVHNELTRNLTEAMSQDMDSSLIQDIDEVNLPLFSFNLPVSCIESAAKEKTVTVPDGYKTMQVTKTKMIERPWYNPMRWVGGSHYMQEYVETEKQAVFKSRVEKEYVMTINPMEIQTRLTGRIRESIEAWKENDTLQIYLSMDSLIERYMDFFEEFEKAKKAEIVQLKNEFDQRQVKLSDFQKGFNALKAKISKILSQATA